jgi:hypothetical protein
MGAAHAFCHDRGRSAVTVRSANSRTWSEANARWNPVPFNRQSVQIASVAAIKAGQFARSRPPNSTGQVECNHKSLCSRELRNESHIGTAGACSIRRPMKQVLTLPESAELELLKHMLEAVGIRCALRNEQLSQALPAIPFKVELWVAKDDDLPRAQELCQDWLHPSPSAIDTWVCAQCGQRLRRQFDSCWKCGAERQMTNTFNSEGEHDENVSRFVD